MGSKIASKLTPLQVAELLEELSKTEGGEKLRVIQQEARKRGIEVSLMGAATFRDGELKPFLEKLKFAKEKSRIFAEAMTDGSEEGLLAGARTTLADQVADFLMNEGAEPKQFASLAMTLQMLSSSNQGERGLRARLLKFEREEAERREKAAKLVEKKKAVVAKGGLSEEAIALMEETLKILS
jgi:hypothetical protein